MSHLIKIYTVCPLVFEFSIWYSLDLNFFLKFADENFVVCFSVVKELNENDILAYFDFGVNDLPWLLIVKQI